MWGIDQDDRSWQLSKDKPWKAGQQIWGYRGIVVSLMRDLSITRYLGNPFDANIVVFFQSRDELRRDFIFKPIMAETITFIVINLICQWIL